MSEKPAQPRELGGSTEGSAARPKPGASTASGAYSQSGGDEIDLRAIWRAIFRNKWLVLSAVAVCLALAYALAQTFTPRYSAAAQVAVAPVLTAAQQARDLVGYSGGRGSAKGEAAAMKSQTVLAAVARTQDLAQTAEYNPSLRDPGPVERVGANLAEFGQGVAAATQVLGSQGVGPAWDRLAQAFAAAVSWRAEPAGESSGAGPTAQQVAKRLQNRVTTRIDRENQIIRIRVQSRKPDRAAALANGIAERYLSQRYEAIEGQLRQALTNTREQIGRWEERLSQAEQRLGQLKTQSSRTASGGQLANQQVATLNSELIRLRGNRQQAEARLKQLREQIQGEGGRLAAARRLEAPALQRLRQRESELLRQRSELATRYGEKHPRMKNLAARLKTIREQMRKAVSDILQQRADRVKQLRQREAELERRLNEAVERIKPDAELAVAIRRAERQIAVAERQLSDLRADRDKLEAALQGLTTSGGVAGFVDNQIITTAEPPQQPSNLQTPGMLAIGGVVGVLMGLSLVLLVELIDMGIRTPEQLERLTGLPVIGMVPLMRVKGRGTVSRKIIDDPTSPFAETVNSVLMALTAGRHAERARVLCVTSAQPFEGKSALAISMARVAARTGQRVMLVDADLRRPSVHRHMGLGNDANLATFLDGEGSIEDVVQRDPESSLFVIPGQIHRGNPLDALGGDDFRELIEALRDYFDLVVIDTPPLLAVADTRSVMRYVDQTLYVVRWGKTHRDAVIAAARTFLYTQPDTVSVVLNQVDAKKFAKYRESVSHQYARYLAEAYPPG